ncbi:hypothetical protein ABZ069_35250 [Streptomyces microflavus]|uniref:ATP-dependent DNA ligase n=1 Tax=Streptomyces microflavus TaxID=1919 RepID=UPI00339E3864
MARARRPFRPGMRRGLGRVRVRGVEYPIRPALARAVPTLPTGPGWSYEVKVDGHRMILRRTADGVICYSRTGRTVTSHWMDLAVPAMALPAGTTLDGEAVIWHDGRIDFGIGPGPRRFLAGPIPRPGRPSPGLLRRVRRPGPPRARRDHAGRPRCAGCRAARRDDRPFPRRLEPDRYLGRPHLMEGLQGVLRSLGRLRQQEAHSLEWSGHRGSGRVPLHACRAPVASSPWQITALLLLPMTPTAPSTGSIALLDFGS